VVAAGSGQRFGAPKQFLELAGRPVVDWSVAAARSVADGVVVVVPEGSEAIVTDADGVDGRRTPWTSGADQVVVGGPTRAASVRAGLAAVPIDASIVVVHDGVRPLASRHLFDAVVAAVREGAAGAVPGVPLGDTVKRVEGGTVVATVDRRGLVLVQTPQAFDAAVLRRAHADEPDATDDAGLLEAIGAEVRVVEGDPGNVKITRPGDVQLVEGLLDRSGGRSDARRSDG
jgi:2-C-methyl-D-erythritol 4-phosphate cytidylyltransferase